MTLVWPQHDICKSSETSARLLQDLYLTSSRPLHDLYMTSTWPLHDLCMSSAWALHDLYMTSTWPLHDLCMTSTWPLHNLCMTSAWPLHDLYMTSTWPLYDLYTTSTRPLYDLCMTSAWPLHDLCMTSLITSYLIFQVQQPLPQKPNTLYLLVGKDDGQARSRTPKYQATIWWSISTRGCLFSVKLNPASPPFSKLNFLPFFGKLNKNF